MEQVFERVCGLDVHKATIAACVRLPDLTGKRVQYVQIFGATTADLIALRDWLEAHGVTHVAMESTGVYWKPVYYVLEERVTCLLVNATHVKKVPGRKTAVQDCAWLAQLLERGLLRGSFVPPAPIRGLRDSRGIGCRSFRSARAKPTASTSCSKTRASSWRPWPGTSSRPRGGPCWRRWCKARTIVRSWPSWRGAACGPGCRPYGRPS